MSSCFLSLVIFIVYIVSVESVPPNYCLRPLNQSDCRLKPLPVFSYYKSGSRCEIEYWRGCPTFNMFRNHYDCVDTCIYHFGMHTIYNLSVEEPPPPPPADNFEDDLLNLPEKELEDLDNAIDDIVDEVQRLKVNITEASSEHKTEHPEPEHHETKKHPEPEEHSETEHPATEHTATEPPETEAPTTTDKTESDESGLPDEVEMP